MIFTSALTGQRVENIFEHALNAVNQHRRRVSTSVVNEVLKESISWKSPPTKRSGKQGRLYYGTQVKNCLLYTSPSPRDWTISRMPSSA